VSEGVTIWRIATDTPDYQADDLAGKGAAKTGGRWNRKGTPLVYASISRALACLETVVHLGAGQLPLNRYLVRITVPREIWEARTVFDPRSQVGWDALPAGRTSIDWGSAWASGGKTVLAEVPSVIVPEEANLLINPRVAGDRLKAVKVRKWTYDLRFGGAAPR
jgi:RES domain-containing protein